MALTNREIAEAFSGHRFDEALAYVADDAEWMLVGADAIVGAAAIADACHGTDAELDGATTDFTRFDVADGGDIVAVDAVGVYTDASGGRSSVSSCDLYTFRDGRVAGIRSYNIELDAA